eukprot:gene21545-27584_t
MAGQKERMRFTEKDTHLESIKIPMRKVRESLDAGEFSQFRVQFKTDRARGA